MEKVEPEAAGAPSVRVDQVLETATRLFTERGYDAASIRDLAAALAMRPSSLYHHFPGKQHILFAICFGLQSDFNAAVMPVFHMVNGMFQWFQARDQADVERIATTYVDAAVALLGGWGRRYTLTNAR